MQQEQQPPRRRISPIFIALAAGLAVILAFSLFNRGDDTEDLDISQVLHMAQGGELEKIEVKGDSLKVFAKNGETFKSRKEEGFSVAELLEQRNVAVGGEGGLVVEVKKSSTNFLGIILALLPLILIGGLVFYFIRRSQGGLNQISRFGGTKARRTPQEKPSVTFDDVAGIDEAKVELEEIVDFLKNGEKYAKLGAKIPKGVLLVGPPGTGKTLVSKAVSGEAGVPFFSISGSEFVEMFVGVGASRVRDLFKQARAVSPSILFIDEIDAVGRSRGIGIGGGNDEREQTLNQILVEMDGFDERTNVIVIAATNRPDVLDPALLRAGRFDRRVTLSLPDVSGREAILRLHLKGKPLLPDLDVNVLARQTTGFSGADLANLANEAAIVATRRNKQGIGLAEMEEAIDRIIAGPRQGRKVSEREREIIAYHEAGHAVVASQLPEADSVHKVTIAGRGSAGGYTRLLPEEDRSLLSKAQLEAMLAVMMGGQTAEAIACNDITTGASNDLQNATRIARKMVTEYGMSGKLGSRVFTAGEEVAFLGQQFSQGRDYGDHVATEIDHEIEAFLEGAKQVARTILDSNKPRLDGLAMLLLEKETLQGDDLAKVLTGSGDGVSPAGEPA